MQVNVIQVSAKTQIILEAEDIYQAVCDYIKKHKKINLAPEEIKGCLECEGREPTIDLTFNRDLKSSRPKRKRKKVADAQTA